jgi:hypothetical protein
MKTRIRDRFLSRLVLACASLLLTSLAGRYCCEASEPVITSIRPQSTNVLVEVSVPTGVQRVTLESRSRFGEGTWAPLAVAQNDGSERTMSFRVPCTRQTELMRVRADTHQPLPSGFYGGTNSFSGPPDSGVGATGAQPGGGTLNGGGTGPSNGATTRTVVESDIWQIDGGTLYFFNQYRGLQVIDITTPDRATVRGKLDLPAAGEQMYLADSNHVILLASGGCGYPNDQSQIIVVAVSNGVPAIVTNLPLEGWIQDSRLVGTALYVASQNYQLVAGKTNGIWEWGTSVASFDLADPQHPVVRGTLWFSGYGNVVNATDTYLFLATQDPANWWQSLVQIIDITSPDGTMSSVSSLRTAGRVPDKFKLNYTNEVLTTISEDWRGAGTGPITELETFHLPDPRSMGPGGISELGELELGSGEQLHATRFDGNLVYVVTFFQIDPLWVVDLSNPVMPHIAGSVKVPGWSSYIAPLGDRLVTVGVESHRVAVSLFDVQNPSQPALLSHLLLGQNYSWSDANYDEKAFTVLPEQGLVLVPYNGDTTNGWTTQVQLIDLTRTNLVARGLIHHQCQPRRAAFSHDRILSLSEQELLSIDATNRDQPEVKGDLELAWSVDRLFVAGDYLLELSGATGWWGYQTPPTLRVTPLHQHDQILNELALDNLPVVGACLKDGKLYVAQSPSYWYILPLGASGGPSGGPTTNALNFVLTVLDASHLPELSVLGQTSTALDTPGWGWGSTWNPVWPKQDVLVWVGGGGFLWPIMPGGVGIANGPAGTSGGALWPWWGWAGGELLAFDVSHPASPSFDSEVDLATNGWWSFSQPFSTGTRVYLSHNESEVLTNSDNPNGFWFQRSQLDVIDYADSVSPTIRNPVNIPGTLQGISDEGELLYTVGLHWGTNQVYDWTQWLEASAYDGVGAHLVASMSLPDSWPHPLIVVDTNVFFGRPGYASSTTNVTAPSLEAWYLSNSGTFTLNGTVVLSQPAYVLADRGGLLVAQGTGNSLDLFDDSNPAALSRVTQVSPTGCLWFDLNQADGARNLGLWIPLGVYGVEEISLGP